MKIATPDEMSLLEKKAYEAGHRAEVFMEEAGSGVGLVVHEFAERFNVERHVVILAGKGNNAGDAYVAGIHLLHLDYHVHAYQLMPLSECSPLCIKNAERFVNEGGSFTEVGYGMEIPYPYDGIIIDGIFGTGFHGTVEDPIASFIERANDSGLPIISVDIPSGLNGETGEAEGSVMEASETAFLGLPKIGFFIRDGWNAVGKLRLVDFGLPREIIADFNSELEMLSADLLLPLLPAVKRTRSKYEAGYVVGLTGSPGMSGAAILSGISALRGGAGIVRLLHPEGMQVELAAAPFELIKSPYGPNSGDEVLVHINRSAACYLGPGIGKLPKTKALLKVILPRIEVPCVMDADALNLFAEGEMELPEKVVMTPHLGEMHRLLNLKSKLPLDFNFLHICQEYAEEKRVTLVVKGGPTFIFEPGKPICVSPVGDPGMATAGSGDILTGLIACLLAQGLEPYDAARLGVYIHGVAGEQAAEVKTSYCMIASDMLEFFPTAFAFALDIF